MGARVPRRRERIASAARLAAALAIPVLALTILGRHAGLVPFASVPLLVAVALLLAVGAVVLAAVALARIWQTGAGGAGSAVMAILYSVPVIALLGLISFAALAYPDLNDVSTDTVDPPVFTAVADAPPPAIPPEAAETQTRSYPDIAPRLYFFDIERVFAAATALVAERGWELAASTPPPEGEGGGAAIEAVAETLVFGFPDLVAVRFLPAGDGTRVDIRSASQLGAHDLGENARRIRAFFTDLDAALALPVDGSGGGVGPEANPEEGVLPETPPRPPQPRPR